MLNMRMLNIMISYDNSINRKIYRMQDFREKIRGKTKLRSYPPSHTWKMLIYRIETKK